MPTNNIKRMNMDLKDILGSFRLVFRFRMWFMSAAAAHLSGFALHTLKNKAEEIAERKLRELKEE